MTWIFFSYFFMTAWDFMMWKGWSCVEICFCSCWNSVSASLCSWGWQGITGADNTGEAKQGNSLKHNTNMSVIKLNGADDATSHTITLPSFWVGRDVALTVNEYNPGSNCFPLIVFSKANQRSINVQADSSARFLWNTRNQSEVAHKVMSAKEYVLISLKAH